MWLSSREDTAWIGEVPVVGVMRLLVHGGTGRHGFSSVEGDQMNLESSPFECGKKINYKTSPQLNNK